MTFPGTAGMSRSLLIVAACTLLAAFLLACGGDSTESSTSERLLLLEAEAHALEESLETLHEENSDLKQEIAVLKRVQAEFVETQDAAEAAKEREEEVADFEEVKVQQLADLEAAQASSEGRLDDLEARAEDLENRVFEVEQLFAAKQQTAQPSKTDAMNSTDAVLERTRKLAEQHGGEVYNIDSREPEERAILVMPLEPIVRNPLIVSLHGYGGNSADHSAYLPLHERVNSHGFGLLLPNGTPDGEGNLAWNPTNQTSDSGKASADDYAYLSGLVARALDLKDFGPVYFVGYSNGGFMAYHMACKGLPGLRAVVSIAGTSYAEDSECEGATLVSVLHVHGTAHGVIRFDGDGFEPDQKDGQDGAFYASARDMVELWARRAGCYWPEVSYSKDGLDMDLSVPGPESSVLRWEQGCAEGVMVDLWRSEGSGHAPDYGDTFVNALLDWLLSQE